VIPATGKGMKAGFAGLAAFVSTIVLSAAPAAAQGEIAVEVRGGASAGSYAAAGSGLDLHPGPSFGATVSYATSDRLAVYAGFSRSRFGCADGFCADRRTTLTSAGVEAGARLTFPARGAPWLRAGVIRHSLRYESRPVDGGGSTGKETDGVGLEAGGGMEVRLGKRLSLTPGVRYVRYGSADDDGVALVIGDVGLRIRM
jgi:hypothetical protein